MTVAGDCFAALATTARVKTELIILTRPLAARKSPPPPDSRSRRRGVSMTGGEAIRELRRSRPDVFIIKPDHHMPGPNRSEEHTSELQSLMRISYAVFCLTKKNTRHSCLYTQ